MFAASFSSGFLRRLERTLRLWMLLERAGCV
jgi:hypothetical protein